MEATNKRALIPAPWLSVFPLHPEKSTAWPFKEQRAGFSLPRVQRRITAAKVCAIAWRRGAAALEIAPPPFHRPPGEDSLERS